MTNTANLDLERPDRGDPDWDTSLNSNMTKLDTGYGNNIASIADIPEVYIETGTFNYTSGDVITLPKSVSAVNEYSVGIIATSRAGAIGDIYVTKGLSSFTVYCSSSNTTDTFSAIIHYIGDVASYGGSIYRRWYVSPDASITDHSDNSDIGSLAWVIAQIGASPATIELPGNKTYTLTAYNVTIGSHIKLIIQSGAEFGGVKTLTFDRPAQFIYNSGQQIFGSSLTVVFSNGGDVYPEWWGANTTPGTTDMTNMIQSAINSIPTGEIRFNKEIYLISSPIIPKTGVSFVGSKESSIIKLANNSDDDMVDFTGTDTDVGFYNITFDNNGINQSRSDSTNTIHASTQVKRLTVKNCTFKNSAYNAIRMGGGLAHEEIIVSGNRFIDYYGGSGVNFWGVHNGIITDNILDNSGIAPATSGNAISVGNISTDVTVSGNLITMADSGAASFGIETGATGTTRISIVGNTIDCGDYVNNGGVSVTSTTNSVVSGNSITKVKNIAAIEIGSSSTISVSGNSIFDIDKPGVAINGENHTISVSNNTIDTFSEQGISVSRSGGLQANVYGFSITGNVLSNGSGLAASGEHAIYINGGPATGLIINNNIIYDSSGAFGINILADAGETHTGYVISGNSFYNVSTYWIVLGGSGTHASYAIVGNSAVTAGTSNTPGSGHVVEHNIEI